jgi:hypothetical protein
MLNDARWALQLPPRPVPAGTSCLVALDGEMFGFGKRKVLREGARAGRQSGAVFGLKLRVHFEDGSTHEVFRRVGFHGPNDLPQFVEGSTVRRQVARAPPAHGEGEASRRPFPARRRCGPGFVLAAPDHPTTNTVAHSCTR